MSASGLFSRHASHNARNIIANTPQTDAEGNKAPHRAR